VGGQGGSCGAFPPAPNQDWQAQGPFNTTALTSGPSDAFRIYQPDPLGDGGLRHPIVVFSVGTGGFPAAYSLLLERIASHGFVVIAGNDGNQAEGDQALAGLTWLLDQNDLSGSLWEAKLDPGRIAATGHSQGGNAALHVALKSTEVGAVLARMPGEGTLGGATKADESLVTAPVFYICGGDDLIVPEQWCLDRFANTVAPAWVGVEIPASHSSVRQDTAEGAEIRYWSIAWLRALLLDDCQAQPLFYGDPFALTVDADWRSVDRKNI
jgi:predicted dienelactone hydrolase